MPFPFGDIISAGGSLIAGGLNYLGQRDANRTNIKIAREQMGFQERMSNTAYQRAVADMLAAGINPMLAAMAGGASSPGGASTNVQNELSGGVGAAIAARQASAGVKQAEALADILKAELVGKKVEAKIYEGRHGEMLKYLQMMASPMSSALSLLRSMRP